MQKELDQLRDKVNESTDPAEIKFKLRFESLVKEFDSTLVAIEEIIEVEGREIHVYRCEKEMHQLHITLQGGVPVLVEGSYSIRKC
ncbi:hypothetical protein [Lysinibacillus sp. NPDC056232]|uniref:hypothetical protein n=1 Tax=Lysinibacillus sp. NPDC056232 TaxID=3345756 RepID=UPI0035D6F343